MTPTNSKIKDAMTMKLCTVIVCLLKINNYIFQVSIILLSVAIVLFGA